MSNFSVWVWTKRTYHRWSSPRFFYQYSTRAISISAWVALLSISLGLFLGLAVAPADYQQGNSFRIIYIHVPAASLAMIAYVIMAVCSFVTLVWKMKMSDIIAQAIAPIGAAFTFLALFTGAVWGKPTWGTWWVWDARLTSMLILLFLYIGLISLREAISNTASSAKMASLLTLIGVINLPIIKYSVEWWNTLHQPATFTLTEKPAMPPEMWIPLLIMFVGSYALLMSLMFLRAQTLVLRKEQNSKWVKEVVSDGI